MSVTKTVFAAAVAAMVSMPASALVMQSQSGIMIEDGQRFSFDFTDLPTGYAGNGKINIASGPATTGTPEDDGFDLDGVGIGGMREFFEVFADGWSLGKYTCGGGVGKKLAGTSMNGPADCEFSFDLALGDGDWTSFLADGILSLVVDFGSGVGHFGDGDQLNVGISYDEVVPAPLPATGLMLLGGLGAVGFVARRRRKAA